LGTTFAKLKLGFMVCVQVVANELKRQHKTMLITISEWIVITKFMALPQNSGNAVCGQRSTV
jgi:hypothetical protein